VISQAKDTCSPLHVLLVVDHFYPHVGGAETLFWQLSRGLAARGNRVCVVTLREPGTSAAETVDGVEIHRVATLPWFRRILFILMAIPAILRRARHADVIHAALYASAFPAWLCGLLLRKPVVLTVHEVFGEQWGQLVDVGRMAGWAFRAYERFLLRLPFVQVVCISRFTAERLRKFAKAPSGEIPIVYPMVDYRFWDRRRYQPADLRERLNLAADCFVYLFFGRPGVSKGLDTLVAAAARIRAQLPASRLVMLLAHEPRDGRRRTLQRIQEMGLAEHIRVLDPVPRMDLPGYLLAADCVVVPSRSEGFGYSAVEAAALGCRVVATSGHAVGEVLGDSVDLVPPDAPEALARAVLDVAAARHPPREATRQFTLQRHLAGMIDVYRRATGKSFTKTPRHATRPALDAAISRTDAHDPLQR